MPVRPLVRLLRDVEIKGVTYRKGEVYRTVTFGGQVVLESPEAPGLPAFAAGQHLVTLEILQGQSGDPAFGFQFPIARYFVGGGGAAARRGVAALAPLVTVRLQAPEDGAQLPLEPPTFTWLATPGAAQYRLEIFEADPGTFLVAVSRLETVGPKVFGAIV